MLAAALCLGIIIPVTLFAVRVEPVNATTIAVNVTDTSTANVRSYYSALNSLSTVQRSGTNLLTNLKPVLSSGHTDISYADVWLYGKITERDWAQSPMTTTQLASYTLGSDNPYVHLLYRNDNGTSTAAHADDTHGSIIDREHAWPQSYGFSADTATGPAGTDLHHLMYADSVNNQQGHSNYFYGNSTLVSPNVGTALAHNDTGRRETITYNGVSQLIYEPQDSDKGDIARACFYMVARYSSYTSTYDPWLTLSDDLNDYITVATYSSTSAIGYGLKSVLLEWNALDPVDDYEIHRNNLIYNNVQHNRNPFIDYPSWVDVVWGTSGAVANPTTDAVTQYGSTPETETFSLAVDTMPTKTTYVQSEAFNSTGLVINKVGSLGSSSATTAYTLSPASGATLSTVGTQTITVSSTESGVTGTTFDVTITAVPTKTLSSIAITGTPTKTTYISGESFDSAGITVTATYSDSSTANVTSSCSFTPSPLTTGTTSVTASYTYGSTTKTGTISGLTVTEPAATTELFISEYIEGNSNNKAIEIANHTGASVSLSNYDLKIYFNGSATANTVDLGTGTIANNDVFVIANSSAIASITAVADVLSGAITFNGNDAVALYKVSTALNIDVIGIIENVVATEWTGTAANGPGSTYNKTLVRLTSVSAPVIYFAWSEWNCYATDTVSYLGWTANGQANGYAVNFLSTTATYCSTLDGVNVPWSTLSTSYGALAADSKDYFYASSDTAINSAKNRYHYLITKYAATLTDNFMKNSAGTPVFAAKNEESLTTSDDSSFLLVILFGFIGITAYLVYSYTNKKRHSLDA